MTDAVYVQRVDVFTRDAGMGNPAGVVLDADGLSDDAMQAVATEMGLSETAFVFAEAEPGVVPVRFFTPECEVPACGHATLGAHFVRARSLGVEAGEVEHRSPGARWRVRWEERTDGTFMVMRQSPVERGPVLEEPLVARLLHALGTGPEALEEGSAVRVVSTGHAKVMVPLRRADALWRLRPDMDALATLSADTGVGGYLVFAPGDQDDLLTVCRMFGPAIGVPEDPVNGSGHGPLGAHLLDSGGSLAAAAQEGFWSGMGRALGRRGRVWVQAVSRDEVEVGGYVTPLAARTVSVG